MGADDANVVEDDVIDAEQDRVLELVGLDSEAVIGIRDDEIRE